MMAGTIVVQVGQCGNQLGDALFDRLYCEASGCKDKEFSSACFRRFFSTETGDKVHVANAVLVDMESKVISKVMSRQQKRSWFYNPNACVSSKQGSGNNWANGYCNYGTKMEEEIVDAVRVISDQITSVSVVLILMSSAGGTGSGLGCKITEIVKEVIPGALVINQVVLPFTHGEVAVQSYNMLLTLSSLYQNSDSIILSHNDQYQALARRLLPARSGDSVSFSEINCLISAHMAGLLLPSNTISGEEEKGEEVTSQLIELDQVVEHLVPHPGYKLLTTRMMPVVSDYCREFTNTSWEMLGKYSRQMLLQNSILDEKLTWSVKPRSELKTSNWRVSLNTCISNLVVCRGTGSRIPHIQEKFTVADIYLREKVRCMFGYSSSPFEKLEKSMFVLSNAEKNGDFLEQLIQESWAKFQAKAFLYQYESFGLGADWFNESFDIVQKVDQDYRYISYSE
ncbi:tubulin delta chain-like [Bolinopsis microptera]|uniref:tubulin delta chain-like n=1 Tax=Bolinopsis microptera TaxID=2820187 RepID=UPI0030792A47